tara:strand:+ start:591 stop:836 length:246 start_codon:yes stop_codon:yes gene_type:complete
MQFITDKASDKFNIETETFADGTIKIMMKPKKTDCFGCNKQIDYKTSNLLVWTDKDLYKREARFCRSCKSELQEMGYFKNV